MALTRNFYCSGGDGYADGNISGEASWSAARAAAGNNSNYAATKENMYTAYTASKYYIRRMFFPVDTSSIQDDATIESATFNFYYEGQTWASGTNPCNFALVGTTQSSGTAVENADFARVGTTRLCDTDILASSAAGWKSMTLNADGIAFVSKNGYTKLGLRGSNDFSDSTAPDGYSGGNIRFSEYADTSSDPYLTVTYKEKLTFGEYLGAGSSTTKLLLHLNGNSTDSSGNGHDLTNYNSTPFENGKFGQAPHFNGTNQSLRGTIDDPDTYASGYTWSFWAYNDATLSARRWIASTSESGGWGTCFAGSWESPYTNLWIKFGRGITNDYGDNTGYTIPVGEWFNVVMVAEGTSQKCYVNGNLVSSTTKSASMANNGTTFSIGSDSGGTDYFWDGLVDEFIQEGRAWSAQEVAKYYTYSKGRFGII